MTYLEEKRAAQLVITGNIRLEVLNNKYKRSHFAASTPWKLLVWQRCRAAPTLWRLRLSMDVKMLKFQTKFKIPCWEMFVIYRRSLRRCRTFRCGLRRQLPLIWSPNMKILFLCPLFFSDTYWNRLQSGNPLLPGLLLSLWQGSSIVYKLYIQFESTVQSCNKRTLLGGARGKGLR